MTSNSLEDGLILNYAQIIHDLNDAFVPHESQILVGQAIFGLGMRRIFVQCGRKWGKTTICIYSLYRFALTHPNSPCYYFAPFQKQAAEIVWHDPRLKHFFPKSIRARYGIKIHEGDYRITFANGSFIKVEGTDNFEANRGVNPAFVVIDEVKDIKPQFWDAYEANSISRLAPILFVGTPPDIEDNIYITLADSCKDHPKRFWFQASTSQNPHISKDELNDIKADLEKKGEEDKWAREYEAEIVFGGSKAIFPMAKRERHVIPHEDLLRYIHLERHNLQYAISFDPGTTTVFAALIAVINPYQSKVFFVDEIYETKAANTTARYVFDKALKKLNAINPNESVWNMFYDYAAAWFANEIAQEFNVALFPCVKDLRNKENKISMLKDLLLHDSLYFSDKCVETFKEYKSYRKDDKGKIVKEKDHNIDNSRYIINGMNFTFVPAQKTLSPFQRGGVEGEELMPLRFIPLSAHNLDSIEKKKRRLPEFLSKEMKWENEII